MRPVAGRLRQRQQRRSTVSRSYHRASGSAACSAAAAAVASSSRQTHAEPGGVLRRRATARPRRSTAQASSVRVPSTARLRPGARRSGSVAGPPVDVDRLAEQRHRLRCRRRGASVAREAPARRRRRRAGAARRRARAGATARPAARASARGRPRPAAARSGWRRRTPESALTTAQCRGIGLRGEVGLGQDAARLGQRDPQRELPDQPGAAPQRLDAGDVLRGEHQVDALRAAAPGEVLQQRHRLGGHRVAAAEQHLELVDHRDDAGPVPARILGAQLGELGRLVPLGRLGPAPQLLGEVAQQRQAELPVVVDVHADQPHVRQPARVARARREPGERHALLEVEQVQRQLVGGVAGAQRRQPGVDQVGLAGAGRPADQRVRRVVAEHAPRPGAPSAPSPSGASSAAGGGLRPELRPAAGRRSRPAAGRRAAVRRASRQNAATRSARGGGSQPHRQVAEAGGAGRAAAYPDPLQRRVVGERQAARDHVYAARRRRCARSGRAARAGRRSAPRRWRRRRAAPRAATARARPPALAAASSARLAYSPAEHALVDPPDLLDQAVEHAGQPARPDERDQAGVAQRGEAGQRAAELLGVVDGQPHLARAGGAERAQQQAGDHTVHRGPCRRRATGGPGPAAAPAPARRRRTRGGRSCRSAAAARSWSCRRHPLRHGAPAAPGARAAATAARSPARRADSRRNRVVDLALGPLALLGEPGLERGRARRARGPAGRGPRRDPTPRRRHRAGQPARGGDLPLDVGEQPVPPARHGAVVRRACAPGRRRPVRPRRAGRPAAPGRRPRDRPGARPARRLARRRPAAGTPGQAISTGAAASRPGSRSPSRAQRRAPYRREVRAGPLAQQVRGERAERQPGRGRRGDEAWRAGRPGRRPGPPGRRATSSRPLWVLRTLRASCAAQVGQRDPHDLPRRRSARQTVCAADRLVTEGCRRSWTGDPRRRRPWSGSGPARRAPGSARRPRCRGARRRPPAAVSGGGAALACKVAASSPVARRSRSAAAVTWPIGSPAPTAMTRCARPGRGSLQQGGGVRLGLLHGAQRGAQAVLQLGGGLGEGGLRARRPTRAALPSTAAARLSWASPSRSFAARTASWPSWTCAIAASMAAFTSATLATVPPSCGDATLSVDYGPHDDRHAALLCTLSGSGRRRCARRPALRTAAPGSGRARAGRRGCAAAPRRSSARWPRSRAG